METIIAACISSFMTLVICLITNHAQHEKTQALISYKIEELEKKVDKHNNVIERTYSLEKAVALQDEQIKVANHRIEDLERVG